MAALYCQALNGWMLPMTSNSAMPSPLLRSYAGVGALLGWFAIALQFYVMFAARLADGRSLVGGVIYLLSVFTILTTALVATTFSLHVRGRSTPAARFFGKPSVATGIAASIVLVDIAYSLLLRHLYHPQGLRLLSDHLLHDLLPLVYLGFWWRFVAIGRFGVADIARWAMYPVLYFIYVLLRGALFGLYPYPFVDVGQLGYPRVLLNAIAILFGFVVISGLLIGLDRLKTYRTRPANTPG